MITRYDHERVFFLKRVAMLTYFIAAILIAAESLYAGSSNTTPSTNPSTPPKIHIVLVGDSTVTPDAGWGNGFIASLTDGVQVTNLSQGGRSSKSFINEGRWQKALALRPDYVLIQFGHNDQKLSDPARGTDPQTTYRQYMNQYVDDARAAGITPVLVTSISRRQWGKDGKIHSTLAPYADVVKNIAAQKKVALIDLHALSIELYEKLGKAEIDTMSPSKPASAPSDDPLEHGHTVLDGTHLNSKGSAIIGRIVGDELGKAVPALSQYVQPQGSASNTKSTAPSIAK